MTRKFSKKEKNFYKQKLIEKATKLFSVLGFKKTSIQDITDAAGIAKGTFYNFFSSKEEILFAIMEKQEEFRDNLLKDLQKPGIEAEYAIRKVLNDSINEVETNKIFKMVFDENLIEKIMLKLPEEKLQAHLEHDLYSSNNFISYFQENSNLIKAEPKIIVGLLRAFFMIPFHKNEIGEEIYDEVIELLIYTIAHGLTKGDVKND